MAIVLGIVVLVVICIVLAARSTPRRRSNRFAHGVFHWFSDGGSSDGGSGFDGGGGSGDGGGC
jgi:hypothetical protein